MFRLWAERRAKAAAGMHKRQTLRGEGPTPSRYPVQGLPPRMQEEWAQWKPRSVASGAEQPSDPSTRLVILPLAGDAVG
jgi:hypothetical protein